MPKDTTSIETTNADKVFDLPVKLQPGHVNTMAFSQDSIAEMHLTPGKELQISFTDGSKVQVENFQELVNSAQSCGKDTIIQLSDNTIIYPEELNAQLAKGAVTFGSTAENGQQVLTLNEPPAGQVVEKNIQPGHEYKMGFDMGSTVSAAQAGQNLILTFKDGGILVMKNYFSSMNSELPPAMTLADGSVIDASALLTSCKLVEQPSFAQTVAAETASAKSAASVADAQPAAGDDAASAKAAHKAGHEKAPNVEPSSGDEAAASNQNVANIEPAAGTAGGISGGHGYGFASEPGGVSLNGLSAIGAIGATNLSYTAPETRLGPVGQNRVAAPVDTNPFGAASQVTVDETGSHSISSTVNFNFGSDGPSTTVPPVQPTGDFAFGGSSGATLTSHGDAVTVTRVGNTYTGTAAGQTVFTLVVQSDGSYTFTQNHALDHADKTNPNDNIILNFGVVGTDKDGDQAVTSISVNVLDDGPVAVDDTNSVASNPASVSGNVLANDNAGFDGSATVTAISVNGNSVAVPAAGTITVTGTYGTLVIDHTGAYTYTSNNTALGTDNFTYTMKDFDGDTSSANLGVTVTDLNTAPTVGDATNTVDETNLGPITVTGAVVANYFSDGPGSVTGSGGFSSGGSKAGNALTSGGVPVDVSFKDGVYTGKAGDSTVFTLKVNADGSYSFTEFKPLDHADKTNPDDVINLNFGVSATDADGDKASGTITINVKDDGPTAVADTGRVTAASPTITGNVTSNDSFGQDGRPDHAVTKVIFNGTTYTLPTDHSNVTVASANGTLTINDTGAYSYTSTTTTGGTDTYSYVIADKDGDTDTAAATATLTISVDDIDYIPTVTNATNAVDETNLGPITVTGAVVANYFSDGPGSVTGSGGFSSGGSKANGLLTSGGIDVAVTQTGNVYTGKAGDVTVFTLTVNANGSYSFTEFKPLDHADKTNPDDVITLNFGVTATDADGDKASGTITINVKDDGPTAVADVGHITAGNPTITGNVTSNDNFGQDGRPDHAVTKVIFNGTTYTLPTDHSNVTVTSANGTLTINDTGAYSYTSTTTTGGTDVYSYVIADKDGDTDTSAATATLTISVDDVNFIPTITNATNTVDETNLGPITVTGAVVANYFSDGPGSVTGSGGFSSGGSKAGNALTSGGVPVDVSFKDGVYTGKAGDSTVFTLKVNADGSYSFTEFKPLDHADKTNPDDVINLNFGVSATDADGDKASGTITINVKDDGPTAVADTGRVTAASPTITGNVTSNDSFGQDGRPDHAVTKVIFNGTTYTLPTDHSNVTVSSANGTLTINDTGAYSYMATNNKGGTDTYSYVIADKDGDTDTSAATATLTISVDNTNHIPTVTSDEKTVDETNLNPTTSVSGSVTANYFGDGAGAIKGDSNFSSDGSKAGNALTSHGVPVAVTYANGVYTGKAGDVTVFTLALNTDGTYTFTEVKPLDHADKTNPDDVINLHFGVIATDKDGDNSAAGSITIHVKDDGPIAHNDVNVYDTHNGGTSGNVISGLNGGPGAADTLSQDVVNTVTKVSFGGTTVSVPATGTADIDGKYGTLHLKADGSYTYDLHSNWQAQTGYSFSETHAFPALSESVPVPANSPNLGIDPSAFDVSYNTTAKVTYISEGAGYNNTLGVYTIGQDGSIQSVQFVVENVNTAAAGTSSTVNITATPGQQSLGFFIIADGASVNHNYSDIDLSTGQLTFVYKNGTAEERLAKITDTGSDISLVYTKGGVETVLQGPIFHTTERGASSDINFDGSVRVVSGLANESDHGTLRIGFEDLPGLGDHDYNDAVFDISISATCPRDQFTYTLTDSDGDSSIATLDVNCNGDPDTIPTIGNASNTVDETNLGPITVTGIVTSDFRNDGPGSVTGSGGFSSGGSKAGNALTSGGVPVDVSFKDGVYTGKAGDSTVFTLKVNADGSYSFTEFKPLDHADKTNPDDVINLNFGVSATDADGDKASGTITINVKDDGPTAVADTGRVTAASPTITGNVTSNDSFGQDGRPDHAVTKVIFNGTTYTLPTDHSNVTVSSANGTLTINDTGAYSYMATNNKGGTDTYSYVIADKDGDTDTSAATATLTISVDNTNHIPTVTSDEKTVDETNLNPTTSVSGSVTANYFGDGAGAIKGDSNFSSDGSKAGNALTSHGVPVAVTYANGVYTGKAGDVTVFTLALNTDGTYTFTEVKPLDHADKTNPDDVINLHFGVIATDKDGDNSAAGSITIHVKDDGPMIGGSASTVQESDIAAGNAMVNGSLAVNYGHDGAGSVHIDNMFSATGSLLNNALTSKGQAVTITQSGDSYIGTAGGMEVFKYTTNADGTYSFKLSRELDHADPKDPHDIIALHFGQVVTDYDGDTSHSSTTINVVDDGPTAVPTPSVAICVNDYIDNVFLPTKDYATVISITADGQGQGNQTLHLVLSNVPSSWVFTPVHDNGDGTYTPINQGVYDASKGTYTLDLAPGVDFDGKFYFKPTSDTDLNHITFTATVSEGGQSSTQSDDFNIIVNGYDNQPHATMAATNESDVGTESIPTASASKLASTQPVHTADTAESGMSVYGSKSAGDVIIEKPYSIAGLAVPLHSPTDSQTGSSMVAYGYTGVGDVIIDKPHGLGGTNDNLPAYSSMIDAGHDTTQSAINNFVYSTSSASGASSAAASSAIGMAQAAALAPTAQEDLLHTQSHVA